MHRVCVSRSRYVRPRRFLLACVPSMRASTMAHDRATSEIEPTSPQRSRNNEGQKSGDPTGSNPSITIEIQLRVGYVSRRGYCVFQSAIQTPLCIFINRCVRPYVRAHAWRSGALAVLGRREFILPRIVGDRRGLGRRWRVAVRELAGSTATRICLKR